MTRFGAYEQVREIYDAAFTSVYLARREGSDDAQFAVKVFRPIVSSLSPQEVKKAVEQFAGRVKIQQKVNEQGGKYWATVHDLVVNDTNAFYVTDFYRRSVQRILDGEVKLDASSLHHLIVSIWRGLIELRTACGRSHGNLKASNVMLAGVENSVGRVALMDPASQGGSTGDATGDLRDLGGILYQLVMRRVFRPRGGWPIPESQEWADLGSSGERWRDLCNFLLDPGSVERVRNLDEIGKPLSALNLRASRTSKIFAGILGATLLVVALVLGYWQLNLRSEWAKLSDESQSWFAAFYKDVSPGTARREAYKNHTYLKRVVQIMKEAEDRHLMLGRTPQKLAAGPPMQWGAAVSTRDAVAAMEKIKHCLQPDSQAAAQWPELNAILADVHIADMHHWPNLQGALKQLIPTVPSRSSEKLSIAIDRLLATAPKLNRFPELQDHLTKLDASAQKVGNKTSDPLLQKFPAFVSDQLHEPANADIPKVVENLIGQVESLQWLADQLGNTIENDWPTVDQDRFKADSLGSSSLADLKVDDFNRWLKRVPDYRFHPLSATDPFVAGLDTNLKGLKAHLDYLKNCRVNKSESTPFDVKYVTAFKWVADFRQGKQNSTTPSGVVRWIHQDLEKAVPAENALIQSYIRDLDAEIGKSILECRPEPTIWLTQLKSAIGTSKVAEDEWAKLVNEVMKVHSAEQLKQLDAADRYRLLRETMERKRVAVKRLDGALVATVMDDPYGKAAGEKRESLIRQAIAELLKIIDAAGTQAEIDPTISQSATVYNAYVNSLQALRKSIHSASALLNSGSLLQEDLPTEKGTTLASLKAQIQAISTSEFPETIVQLAKNTLERISALEAVGQKTRAELVADALGKQPPGIVRAAWLRLGKETKSAWPTQAGELSQEAKIEALLRSSFASLDRKANVMEELGVEGLRRWGIFAVAAATGAVDGKTNLLSEASKEAEGLNIKSPVEMKLLAGSGAAYDVVLWRLKERVRLGDDDPKAANEAATQMQTLLDANFPERQFVELLSEFAKAPNAGVNPNAKYRLVESSVLLPDVKFRRVTPTDAPAFYLATSEMSLGDFINAARLRDDWAKVLVVMFRSLGPDVPRAGPCVWTWNPKLNISLLDNSPNWLRVGDQSDYPPQLWDGLNRHQLVAPYGDNPSSSHPMQYVSPFAAIYIARSLGFRLPSSTEWLMAYGESVKSNQRSPVVSPHLRGVTFTVQKEHVRQSKGALPWPDAEIFWPANYAGPRREGAAAEPGANKDDPILWFRPVNKSDYFADLIGNVAEYVWESPAEIEKLPLNALDQDVKTLLEKPESNQLFVIGGSALSPKELNPLTPYPVDLGKKSQAWKGYSDVGFRLAFTAQPRTSHELLQRIVDGQKFMPSGTIAADATTKPTIP